MFGFVIAALSVAGLIALGRSRRHGYGGMRFLFRRLDTTPAQEKVIRDAVLEMRAAGKSLREQVKDTRPELANMVRSGQLREGELNAWVSARLSQMEQTSPQVVAAFLKIHEVLDESQRNTVADMFERGRPFPGWGRHHHHYHGCHRMGGMYA